MGKQCKQVLRVLEDNSVESAKGFYVAANRKAILRIGGVDGTY